MPGKLNSTGREDPSCLSHISACPWTLEGITATTQLPAHRRGALHLLKTLLPSPAARERIAAEIDCALPNLLWNHSIQLPAIEASHAGQQGREGSARRGGLQVAATTRTSIHSTSQTMNRRQPVLTGFHAHGHYGVSAPGHYESMAHSGAFARVPMRAAPVLAPVGFTTHTHHQHHAGHHQPVFHRVSGRSMADAAYMPSEEEYAHLQKLSNEYEPEATVSLTATMSLLDPR